MKRLFRQVQEYLAGLISRFLSGSPANAYEDAIFVGLRGLILTLGRGRLT